mmetsp:Transcript_25773/g.30376  ORF Transcript_25773/g.30376 Transcript_25773/m.30376 type:complete len:401 (-) Transcript_25773:126-1328(-)
MTDISTFSCCRRRNISLIRRLVIVVAAPYLVYSFLATNHFLFKKSLDVRESEKKKDDISRADITPLAITTVKLNATDDSLHPVYLNGCCGIGHRLGNILPGIVYANRHGRKARIFWVDVPWSVLFNDTDYIETSNKDAGFTKAQDQGLTYWNCVPSDWSSLERKIYDRTGTVFDHFEPRNDRFFDDPSIAATHVSMRDSLSPLVLSYLSHIRAQLNKAAKSNDGHMSICTHVRQGNNETGDWERKPWRSIDLGAVLNSISVVMKSLVESRNATMATIYVASDNESVRPWFDSNVPKNWEVIQPKKVLLKPKNGVWFGEHGSKTGAALSQTMKNEAMAEGMSEVFALGECDALIIPNYSSFSILSIALMKARKNPVFFRAIDGVEYREMSTFTNHLIHEEI